MTVGELLRGGLLLDHGDGNRGGKVPDRKSEVEQKLFEKSEKEWEL